ncbi:MAG TPA: hypothetical protein VGK09_03410 [Rhodocyclaceae bacterium]|jgi:hypothetical protein
MEQSFYQSLYSNDTFAIAIGRLTLSSAKLESCIKAFIEAKGVVKVSEKAPLGGLIKVLLDNHKIDRTAGEHLQFVLHQRNYFVHKLHANLSEYPTDEHQLGMFINRANSLSEEMEFFSGLLVEAVNAG